MSNVWFIKVKYINPDTDATETAYVATVADTAAEVMDKLDQEYSMEWIDEMKIKPMGTGDFIPMRKVDYDCGFKFFECGEEEK